MTGKEITDKRAAMMLSRAAITKLEVHGDVAWMYDTDGMVYRGPLKKLIQYLPDGVWEKK